MNSNWEELDVTLSSQLQVADQPGRARQVAGFLAHSGDSWFWLAGLGVLMLIGGRQWKVRAKVLAESILMLAVGVQLLKRVIRRPRPAGEWGEIYRKTDPHSFPSGHAARAGLLFGLVPVVGPSWFGAVMLVWAPLMALSRVAMGLHYVSDVVVGFAVGGLVALGLAGQARRRVRKAS